MPGLGRSKSEPDERNFRLGFFLQATTPPTKLEALYDALKYTTLPPSMKAWAKEVTTHILGREPLPPLPVPPAPVRVRKWSNTQPTLDQLETPHCVGFSWAQWSNAEPVRNTMTANSGHEIYYAAKHYDGEPGAENGSTMHSGAKAMKDRGRLNAYAFTKDLEEIKTYVLTKGPLPVGTYWTSGMFNPSQTNYVYPTGSTEGGHAYYICGYSRNVDVFTFQNSWGSDWGDKGYFYMKANDWFELFSRNNDGEAVAAVELAL